jgi:LDH2 family malate/lactate/ureidoglycolate dehydrogenase
LPGKGIGHFVGAMRIDAFRPASDFKTNMDLWIQRFKASERINAAQAVLIPGELEYNLHQQRLQEGIPLHPSVANDLQSLAQKLGLNL